MNILRILLLVFTLTSSAIGRHISIFNKCSSPIWVHPKNRADDGPELNGGKSELQPGDETKWEVSDKGWEGQLWAKTSCNSLGVDCAVGQSLPPCPSTGCQPPADTKAQFNLGQLGHGGVALYDISVIDGYTLGIEITPETSEKDSCVPTKCDVSLKSCPNNEAHVGDLRVRINDQMAACLSPCRKWSFAVPYGFGKPTQEFPGSFLCCPSPAVTAEQCRAELITTTNYFRLMKQQCPTVLSYAYDETAGLHLCPDNTSFTVTFCP